MRKTSYKKLRKKKFLPRHKVYWIFVCIVLCGAFFFYLVFVSPVFAIQGIIVHGAKESLNAKVHDMMRSKNIVFLNGKSIQRSALKNFPELSAVDIHRTFQRTVEITLYERKEIAAWCHEKNACFSVDAQGVIFQKKDPHESDFLIQDSFAFAGPFLGQKVMQDNVLSFVRSFREKTQSINILKDTKAPFISVTFISQTRAHWKNVEGWEVYSNPQGDLQWQFTKLQAVLEKNLPSEKRKTLTYIDVRFGSQAYLKY